MFKTIQLNTIGSNSNLDETEYSEMKIVKKLVFLCLLILSLTACGGGSKYEKTVQQGDELLAAGNYEQAIETYSTALELQESSSEAYQGMGKAYLALEQYEDAAAALDKAIELGAQSAELYAACGDAYFAIGGAAADDLSRIEAQQTAMQRYKSALELQPEESSYYQKLADYYIGLGEYSQALELLEEGAAKTKDADFQEQAEQVKHTLEVQESLSAVPYFGDRTKCIMSAEQAAGYAQLLADGIRGAIPVFDKECELCYANYDSSNVAYWDQPFSTYSDAGDVETTRGYALLCDLAGDGRPYLLLMDEDTRQQGCFGDTSVSIYGWQDGKAVQLFAYEGFLRWEYAIFPLSGGGYGLSATYYSPHGEEDGGFNEYLFVGGGLAEGNVEVAEDSVSLTDYLSESCSLKEMVDGLNAYATTVSDGNAPVADYTFHTDKQQAAKAMLDLLKNTGDVLYTRLVDMDGDGGKELILFEKGQENYGCDIYQYRDGALKKVLDCDGQYEGRSMGVILEEICLMKHESNGTYAIQCEQYMGHPVDVIYTLKDQWAREVTPYTEEDWMRALEKTPFVEPEDTIECFHNGSVITEKEYNANVQYDAVELITEWSEVYADLRSGNHRQETVDELISWLK